MKVISLGSDRGLFKEGSEIRARILLHSEIFDELHIIVFTRAGFSPSKIGQKVWLYPTNSRHRLLYVWDALRIGRSLSRPDWLTAQDPFEAGLAAYRLARYFSSKLQLQIHTDFLHPAFRAESVLNRIRVRLARFLLPRADRVRVVSKKIAESIAEAGIKLKRAVYVLPVYIDVESLQKDEGSVDWRKKYPEFDKIVLMASRLTREKRIELALRAWPEVLAAYPHAGLVIAGDGPERQNLEKLVSELKIGGSVRLIGWVDKPGGIYHSADLFLLTSAYEGYGRTIVESLVCGVPVISTQVGVAREVGAKITNGRDLPYLIKEELSQSRHLKAPAYPFSVPGEYLAALRASFTI